MSCHFDDRGISIAVTHVLSIGITTVLLAGLLLGATTMLGTQQDQNTEIALETVGERIAGEIADYDRMVQDGDEDSVRVSHPSQVAGTGYTVELRVDCSDGPFIPTGVNCVVLTATDDNIAVFVPVATDTLVDHGESVGGGSFVITTDDSGFITVEAFDA